MSVSINSVLGIKFPQVIAIKGDCIEELTGLKVVYVGEREVLKLGRCLVWQAAEEGRVFAESDTAAKYEIRAKKRGKGLTAVKLNKKIK
jgi:hypothetical protein